MEAGEAEGAKEHSNLFLTLLSTPVNLRSKHSILEKYVF